MLASRSHGAGRWCQTTGVVAAVQGPWSGREEGGEEVFVAELPLVAGAQELKEPGGRKGIRRIGMGLDEGEPVSRANARSRD